MIRFAVGNRGRVARLAVAIAASTFACVPGAGAAAVTSSIVVRVTADPAPAGIDWSFRGVGPVFTLGSTRAEQRTDVAPGTYNLVEQPTRSGQPKTLTRISCNDPSGDTSVDVRSSSATVAAADGETVTCTFTHRALGARPGAAAIALARAYAPILRLSSSETYRPLRIEDYLATSVVRSGSPPHGKLSDEHPTAFTLPLSGAKTYLDIRGAEPARGASAYAQIEHTLEAKSPRPMVYWHLRSDPANERVAVEYWLLYLYNAFYDRHEADWEGVTVFLQRGKPVGMTYSQHQSRRWVDWTAQTKIATHPVVFVARGSHATYPRAGNYGVRVCWTIRIRACAATRKRDVADGAAAKLDAKSYDLHEFAGAPYRGGWGSGNYVFGIGLTRDRVTDPRTRLDYANPFRSLPH